MNAEPLQLWHCSRLLIEHHDGHPVCNSTASAVSRGFIGDDLRSLYGDIISIKTVAYLLYSQMKIPIAFQCLSSLIYDSQSFRSGANSLPGANQPIELANSLPRTFAPGPFRSLAHSLLALSFPGTLLPGSKWPWNVRSVSP